LVSGLVSSLINSLLALSSLVKCLVSLAKQDLNISGMIIQLIFAPTR